MADTKISAAADIVSVVATDMLPVARSGSTTAYHATMAEMATWANTNLPVASTTVLGASKIDGTSITVSGGVISSSLALSGATPLMDGTPAPGSGTTASRTDHVHPTDTTRAPLASPTFTGTPSLPTGTTGVTQTAGNSTTALATTAFVATSFAPLASPTFSGTPSLPTGTTAVTQTVGTNTTALATTAFVQAAAAPAFNDVGRNLIHNPVYTVQQRGTGPWTATGFTADRWVLNINAPDTGSGSLIALSDTDRAAIGDQSATYCYQTTFTGTATGWTGLGQRLEGLRRHAGRTVTASFWAMVNTGTPRIGINVNAYFGSGGSPTPAVWGTAATVTLSNTWTRYSVQLTAPSAVGATFGTTAGTDYLWLNWFFSAGGASAASGGIPAQSGTISLWGVQLEYGSVATSLAKRDPADELALAQRFYQTGVIRWVGYGAAGATTGYQMPFLSAMRATPTVTPTYTTQTNCTGASNPVWDTQSIYVNAAVTALGTFILTGTFTASADL